MKEFLGIVAILIGAIGYSIYIKDILANRTKPHYFSWLVWGILTAIGFFGQVAGQAGPGAWVTGFTAIVCLTIAALAYTKGVKDITFSDKASLTGAGIATVLWLILKDPLWSVILVTLIDALGFFPTFRKAFSKPNEETASQFVLAGLKFVLAFFALEKISILTTLYPASLIFMNWVFVIMLLVRRKLLPKP